MCRDFYSIEFIEGSRDKKLVYYGFTWARDNADGERDPKTGELLDYAFTSPHNRGTLEIPLSEITGDPCEYVAERFSETYQDQEDISEGAHHLMNANFEAFGGETDAHPARLHISDVSDKTPCGKYYYDSCDEPRFTYVPSKAYAAFVDAWDEQADAFLSEFLQANLPQGKVDPESSAYQDTVFELTREFLVPALERFGFSIRPDGTDF